MQMNLGFHINYGFGSKTGRVSFTLQVPNDRSTIIVRANMLSNKESRPNY